MNRALTLTFSLTLAACASTPTPCPVTPEPATPTTEAPKTPAPSAKGPLILDGTPPIPSELSASLLRYLESRSASVAAISDDGKTLLITTRLGTSEQVYRVDAAGGQRTQVTFEAEPVRQARFVPTAAGAPGSFVFVRDIGGNEQYQIYRADPGEAPVLLTDGRSRHGGFAFLSDGRLVFTSNARNGKDMDLWLSDGRSFASARLLTETAGTWSPLDVSPDDKTLVVQQFISIAEQRLHLVDLTTGQSTQLTPDGAAYRDAVFDSSGKRLFVTTDRPVGSGTGEFVELHVLDLNTKESRSLTANIPWNVEAIALSHDGRTLAATINEEGYSTLRLFDTKSLRELKRPNIPQGLVGSLRVARKAPVLAFSFGGPTVNGDAYTFDLKTQKVTRWTRSELGGLDEAGFVAPTLIRYPSFDGKSVPSFVFKPKGPNAKGPFPVVISIHGGPESQARPSFNPLVQYLTTQSHIAVLVPNVRGSDGYGKTWLSLDNGRLREDSVKDIGALIDWIGTQPDLDKTRVAVIGGSYGGYMVLASLIHFADRLVAGVDVVGISNFVTFLENTAAYRRDLRRVEYGDESDPSMREFLLSISPTTHAAKIKSALFVAHGANDPRVPLSEAEQIVDVVRKNGQDVWKMVAMNEGHGFAKRENRDAYLSLAVLFLQKHLAPR
ncbi:MAG TPA: alpha/beta fold hydrolase [Myxococcota bacterium]|nr:alpha/beta fold hydrolase [Myxococcota bacterium]